jgi:drug/metabolite transporter (DMT)-like permease
MTRSPDTLKGTLCGFLAVFIWSSLVAFSRTVLEAMGTLSGAACVYLLGALFGRLLFGLAGKWPRISSLPWTYLVGCGVPFVAYIVCFNLAIGLSQDREQAIEVAIVNYLWPAMTLVFSVPVLNKRARISLVPGILLAFSGVAMAMSQSSQTSGGGLASWFDRWIGHVEGNWPPYLLALVAAVLWGLYSTLSRRLAGGRDMGAIPIFLLVSGVILYALRPLLDDRPVCGLQTGLELIYMALFPALLAYTCWDIGMRRGNVVLVASVSYLTPLFSTVISCKVLRVPLTWHFLVACALVILGAVVCKYSVVDAAEPPCPASPGPPGAAETSS